MLIGAMAHDLTSSAGLVLVAGIAFLLVFPTSCLREKAQLCPLKSPASNQTFTFTQGLPKGCHRHDCEFFVGIRLNNGDRNLLDFVLEGQTSGWVALGFSKTASMYSADVVGCRRSVSESITIIDTWNDDLVKTNVLHELQDDLCYYYTDYTNGRLACSFGRSIKGSSPHRDLDLNDNYYLMYGLGDTLTTNLLTEGFSYHEKTPPISEMMINPVSDRSLADALLILLTSKLADESDTTGKADSSNQHCPSPTSSVTSYHWSQGIPEGCSDSHTCDIFVGINSNSQDSNMLDFTLEANAKGWVAIGFSKTPNMPTADVLGCNVYSDGSVAAIDTWNPSGTMTNKLDNGQSDICQYSAKIENGRISCTFSRSLKGTSKGQDLDLNSNYYFLIGIGNTPQASKSGGFTYHEKTPTISGTMMNPSQIMELSKIASPKTCPMFSTLLLEYRLSLSYPKDCDSSTGGCDFFLGINTNSLNSNYLDFTLEGKAKGWVAVGFSKTPSMPTADVLGCNIYGDGTVAAIDTWNPSGTKTNVLDKDQNDICQDSARFENGIISCKFSRSLEGTSQGQDLDLNTNHYVFYGVGDTPQSSKSEGFTFHEKTPAISASRINPTRDNSLTLELAMVTTAEMCPKFVAKSVYQMSIGSPTGCNQSAAGCDFFLGINANSENSNYLDFTLEGKAKGWVAVGFSKTPNMPTADVLGCNVYSDGSAAAIDTWNPSGTKTNVLDKDQSDICQHSVQITNGRVSCMFSRSFKGDSKDQDLDLNSSYYILYGTGDTPQTSKSGGFTYHQKTPAISTTLINPTQNSNSLELAMFASAGTRPTFLNSSTYRISIRSPSGCNQSSNGCNYFLGINTNSKNGSYLDFTLEGKAKGWVAVGFSKTPNMPTADVLGCNVYSDGSAAAIDTWNPSGTKTNVLDKDQSDICQHSVQITNGRVSCMFSRSFKGDSKDQDLDLNSSYYILYGTGDTPQASKSGGFTYHQKTPAISTTLINPTQNSNSLESAMVASAGTCPTFLNSSTYRISIRSPSGCNQSSNGCNYFLGINTNSKNSSYLDFTLEGKAKGWVAVGFSKTPNMPTADVLGCNVYSDGSAAAIDTWNPSGTKTNVLDKDQSDICQHSVQITNGRVSCMFSRSFKGDSKDQDLDLNSSYYILYGTGDTPQASKSGGFTYHQKTPAISTTLINPTQNSNSLESAMVASAGTCPTFLNSSTYRISIRSPSGCNQSSNGCNYFLGINTNSKNSSYLDFTLESKAKGWVAVGFSKTPNMPTSDVVGCNVYSDGTAAAIDTWNPSGTMTNVLDKDQADICQHSVQIVNGRVRCTFSRSFKGDSKDQDLDLNSSYYILYGTGDTPQASKSGGFTYHQKTPAISTTLINPAQNSSSLSLESAMVASITTCPTFTISSSYRISLSNPQGCNQSSNGCNLFVGINTNSENSSYLDFTLEAKVKGWVAIGFSKTPDMLTADVLGCNVYSDGSAAAIDTWNPSGSKTNMLDKDKGDICRPSAQIENGKVRCTFSRLIKGTSTGQDLDLDSKYYLLYGTGSTPQGSNKGGFTFHETTPIISSFQLNPVRDSEFTIELAVVLSATTCPLFTQTSKYRISVAVPSGCEKNITKCTYFLGINTNSKNSSYIDFHLEGSAKGWVAVGFSDTASMNHADVFGCNRYGNGTVLAIDTWNPTTPKINVLDEPQTDICTNNVTYSNGRLSCKFSRKIVGDTPGRDLDINADLYLMFGTGETAQSSSSGGFTYHQTTPTLTSQKINVVGNTTVAVALSQKLSGSAVRALTKAHGILMIIAWPIMASAAIYYPAYLKAVLSKKGEWFHLHRGLMLASLVTSSISFVIIFVAHVDRTPPGLIDVSQPLPLAHFILGIIITGAQMTNAALSLCRCKPSHTYRWIYNIVHGKFIGYSTVKLAVINIAIGIFLLDYSRSQAFNIFIIVSFVGSLMFITLHITYNLLPMICKKRQKEAEEVLMLTTEKTDHTRETVVTNTYWHHLGTLILVEIVLVSMNLAVCLFILAS